MAQDIFFRGLAAPLRLDGAEAVLPLLPGIAAGWPYECRRADPALAPFFSIRARPGEPLFLCQSHVDPKPARRLDPLNALCDATAALALALAVEDPRLICLHAAAIAMAGRLVVFPSVRRAGKSTLSVALARAGHAVFSDDVLPLTVAADGTARGHAMGIAPRLRLPLPVTIPDGFRDWAEAAPGPRNRQYKYLTIQGQPVRGATLPVGAFVILDRQEASGPAHLDPVMPDVAMDVLLQQNFTRDRHSADILQAIAATLERPVFRLSYTDLADAVACLEATFSRWPDADRPAGAGSAARFRLADFGRRAPVALHLTTPLCHRPGTVARVIGDTLYLADAEGRAIHRMDPLAAAIWAVLEDPVAPEGIEALLVEAFPEVARDRIAEDLRGLLARFTEAGLIEARAER